MKDVEAIMIVVGVVFVFIGITVKLYSSYKKRKKYE